MPDYGTATELRRDVQRAPSQTSDALKCMADALKEHEAAITELEQRLQSVLRASGPRPEITSEKAEPLVALAQQITRHVLGLAGQTERVHSILSRLEL